jgi:DNA (cytosine-5)-methyltransferase 1
VKPLKVLAADLFCGAGGFTTALLRELAKMGVDCELTAINHNPVAIATHSRNHPRARHEIMDLNTADPAALVPEGKLDILLASPTCTFHSRARGGKPTSDQERMDPWVIVTWCTKLRVQRLICENVPEFVEWGPVDRKTGRPIKARKGEYFRAFLATLELLFKHVGWQIVTAADHGDATTRARFFLFAREQRTGPIRWPEPTFQRDGVADLFGQKKRWRAAREIINWNDRGRSIFGRPVPLKPNTLRRIRAGASKFSGPWAEVFRAAIDQELYRSMLYWDAGVGRELKTPKAKKSKKKPSILWVYDARLNASRSVTPSKAIAEEYVGRTKPCFGEAPCQLSFVTRDERIERSDTPTAAADYLVLLRGTGSALSADLPVPAITAGGNHVGVVQPFIFQVNQGHGRYRSQRAVDQPLYTVLTRDSYGLADPRIHAFTCANRWNNMARGVNGPIHGTTGAHGGGIFLPLAFLLAQGCNGAPQLADRAPVPSLTTVARIQLIEPVVSSFVIGQHGGAVARETGEPLPTIACGGAISLVQPFASPFVLNRHGENGAGCRGRHVDLPLPTATRSGAGYLVEPYLAVMKGLSESASIDRPAPAITTRRHLAVIEPFLLTVNHSSRTINDHRLRLVSAPLPTLTGKRGLGFAAPFLTPYYGAASMAGGWHSHPVSLPLPTVTTKDRFALVQPFLIRSSASGPRKTRGSTSSMHRCQPSPVTAPAH